MTEEIKKSNKITIIMLIVMFVSPVVLSWFIFNYTDFLSMRGTSNKGDLIEPIKPLGELELTDPFNDERKDSLYGKWSLVYVSSSCEKTCMDNVYTIRQIHTMMDKHSLRVQRVLLLKDQAPDELKEKLAEYVGQQFINNELVDVNDLVAKFKLNETDSPLDAARIYIVDPLGNLMMSFEPGTNPKAIYKDLKKLLRGSRIG